MRHQRRALGAGCDCRVPRRCRLHRPSQREGRERLRYRSRVAARVGKPRQFLGVRASRPARSPVRHRHRHVGAHRGRHGRARGGAADPHLRRVQQRTALRHRSGRNRSGGVGAHRRVRPLVPSSRRPDGYRVGRPDDDRDRGAPPPAATSPRAASSTAGTRRSSRSRRFRSGANSSGSCCGVSPSGSASARRSGAPRFSCSAEPRSVGQAPT